MEKSININIAVLVACYNRREKTLNFLESFVNQSAFDKFQFDIYLVDDGSTDGTSSAVKEKYSFVTILTGDGNLWWVGAMIMAWDYAIKQKSYDLFLLVNDDIILFDNALERCISNYTNLNRKGVILVGSTKDTKTNKQSYGGKVLKSMKHNKYSTVLPHDYEFVPCHLGNANFLLVDAYTVEKIGIFTSAYEHKYADWDYTLTAHKVGISVLIAPGYYAWCDYDHGNNSHLGRWLSGSYPLRERIKFLYKPNGLAYKESLHYTKKHFPSDYYSIFIKLWLKTFFPIIWDKFKK